MKQLWLLFLLIGFTELSAQTYVISGRITDAKTGEILSQANLLDMQTGTGVASNTYGLYSIRLKEGTCILKCSMLGYVTKLDTLRITDNRVVNFALVPDVYLLEGVEVVGNRKHGGQLTLDHKDIQALPTVGGEPDVIKSLQFLPGVVSVNAGANNISIRGGDQWENLVLLDEAVVYNPSHALSFFSVFNNDAVQKVNLYKSYFPLNYGGRSSAVIDVRMREGNTKEQQRSATVGLIASKLLWEGPLKKRKGSYLLTGRIAYPGAIANLLGDAKLSNTMMFYDVNAKVNTEINEKNRIYFSIYNGGDYTEFNNLVRGYGMNWGNTTGTFRWNRIVNEKTNASSTAIFSNYFYSYKSLRDGLRYRWKSNMQSYQLKHDWEYTHSNDLNLKAGGAVHFFTTMPGSVSPYGDMSNITPSRMDRRNLLDVALYGETEYRISSRFLLNAGIRLTALYAPGSAFYHARTFILPEPRAEISYFVTRNSKFHLSYNQASQNLHMLSNSSVGLPSDSWMPVNSVLRPSITRQLAFGYEQSLLDGKYTCSVETYYRKSNHVIDYKDNADVFLNNRIEDQVEVGLGKGYGVEFRFAKQSGQLTGWVSYTYARAHNRMEGIDKGVEYPSIYDRPHNLRLFLDYNVGKRWSLSSTFSYTSGMNLTLPIGTYHYENSLLYVYSSRNGYRAPAFHQLDLSATYKWRRSSLVCSFVNVYNRKNVFSIYAGRDDKTSIARSQAYKMYLYGFVPSLSYNFKF